MEKDLEDRKMAYLRREAMPREKKWVEDNFIHTFEQSMIHLAKLYLYGSDLYSRNGWKQEVFNKCPRCYKLLSNNKPPSKEDLYQWYKDVCEPDVMLGLAAQAPSNASLPNEKILEFSRIQDEYAEWACEQYSLYDWINQFAVYAKIDQLFGW